MYYPNAYNNQLGTPNGIYNQQVLSSEQQVAQGPLRYAGEGHYGPIFVQDSPCQQPPPQVAAVTAPPRNRMPWQALDDPVNTGPPMVPVSSMNPVRALSPGRRQVMGYPEY
eukprot:NODE_2807_length_499_cov_105.091398_g2757_i0.p1 GENE.NODE_2807_length_499_cov_105.091398_g2757_i0~~NODE_2807_length_499_cov_105.091398_g2757_i0.p1  ORF type:complete len:111 (+),score=15.75 NODE_2807_length_499_cov_105.091398_g2757_i0:92-424(+)